MCLARRIPFRILVAGLGLVGSLLLAFGSTDAVWAGAGQQTIPTVTATAPGEQPVITLPDGLAPADSPVTQPFAFELSDYFLPLGCGLLFCLAGLVSAGLIFNLWARRQKSNAKASAAEVSPSSSPPKGV